MTGPPDGVSHLAAANVLIGIDDTDNLVSRGTGRLVQVLLASLEDAGLGSAIGATRHQLLVDPRIPYTSHNSSACIAWNGGPEPNIPGIITFAAEFLEEESALASDPGLAVATATALSQPGVREKLSSYGRGAKREVLNQALARGLAGETNVHLSGHGGDEGGVIGALAAIGLHLSGDDGLFLWMRGIRNMGGQVTYRELLGAAPIDAALDPSGMEPAADDVIDLGNWVRPVLQAGHAVLMLRARPEGAMLGCWQLAAREVVKTH